MANAFALMSATNDAMMDESVKATALALMTVHADVTPELFQKLLFEYTANAVAVTADLITRVFLTEEQIAQIIAEAVEIEKMGESDA